MSASGNVQVGGEHYQTPVQHWDWAQYIGYLEGCATKYIGRHLDKNGLEDIQKAITFIDKILRKNYGMRIQVNFYKLEEECDYNVNE